VCRVDRLFALIILFLCAPQERREVLEARKASRERQFEIKRELLEKQLEDATEKWQVDQATSELAILEKEVEYMPEVGELDMLDEAEEECVKRLGLRF